MIWTQKLKYFRTYRCFACHILNSDIATCKLQIFHNVRTPVCNICVYVSNSWKILTTSLWTPRIYGCLHPCRPVRGYSLPSKLSTVHRHMTCPETRKYTTPILLVNRSICCACDTTVLIMCALHFEAKVDLSSPAGYLCFCEKRVEPAANESYSWRKGFVVSSRTLSTFIYHHQRISRHVKQIRLFQFLFNLNFIVCRDGWEKLGLFEFLKAKDKARRIKQAERKSRSRSRSKSRSPVRRRRYNSRYCLFDEVYQVCKIGLLCQQIGN